MAAKLASPGAIALGVHLRYFTPMNGEKHSDMATPAPGSSASLMAAVTAMRDFLEGQKAENVFVHAFSQPNAVCDAIIIATATSRRHAKGLADGLLALCRECRHEFLRMEGYEEAQWVLVDCNDIIVHIFQPDVRQLYALEDLCAEPEEKIFNKPMEMRP